MSDLQRLTDLFCDLHIEHEVKEVTAKKSDIVVTTTVILAYTEQATAWAEFKFNEDGKYISSGGYAFAKQGRG